MKKKLLYEVPESELIVVHFENGILNVSGGGNITNAVEEDYDEI